MKKNSYYHLSLIFSILLLNSCSKFSYITEQGYSQMKIQWSGEKIDTVLKRTDLHKDHRRKIELIQKAKEFFFNYLQVKPTKIYREVVFLKQEAVTYLVTASSYKEVKPIMFSFPITGSFPYIGFFNQQSALSYAKDLEDDGNYTYLRPVYAYSTLGHFEDKILSSFFYLDDVSLVETIYHELFHTLFFVKDEVDFNENLASFFALKMLEKTDFLNSLEIVEHFKKQEVNRLVIKKIIEAVQDYSFRLKSFSPKNKIEADIFLKKFVNEELRPKILEECIVNNLRSTQCTFANRNWNHASFSAFLTYEKDQFYWEQWWNKQIGMTSKVFYKHLLTELQGYKENTKGHSKFEDYIKKKFEL